MLYHCFLIQRNDWETLLLSFPRANSLFRSRGALPWFERFFLFKVMRLRPALSYFPFSPLPQREKQSTAVPTFRLRVLEASGSRRERIRNGFWGPLLRLCSCRSCVSLLLVHPPHPPESTSKKWRVGLCLTWKWMKMNRTPLEKKQTQNEKKN